MTKKEVIASSIVCFNDAGTGVWRIKIKGRLHPSTFVSEKDCRMWCGAMFSGGLYVDYPIYVQSETGALHYAEPIYID